MEISLEFSYESLNLSEIEDFEQKINSKIPDDYRNFLSLYNGGKPVKRRFKTKDGKVTSSLMLLFPLSELMKST
jgi:hypothetical protein